MKVKLLNKIDKKGLAELGNGYTVGEDIADADAYLVRSASLLDAEFPASLRAIARAGAGVNNIPLDRCAEQGIVVFNTPGATATGVKELAIASLLIASRRITEGIAWANTLTGEVGKQVEKGKSAFAGPEISGKTLGVIGLGAIGGIVANAAASLGRKVVGCDPYITLNAAWSLSRDVSKADSYDELFPLSDYITLHVPSLPSTKGMINAESIAKMRDGVRIINLSRGDIVNSDDIIAAVKSGKVARYVTDFPDEKLLGIDNIICIPHLGASTPESEENCAIMAARELTDFLENGNIHNSVNYPEISMPRISAHRIIVLHENIPNMLAQVSSAISASGVNIDHMVSSSKNTSAAALFDSDNEFSADVIASISAVSGVRKAILLS